MTDEVARLVLRNNYQQTLALSLAQRRGLEDLGFQQRLMQTLEKHGQLDRAVEFLPDEMAIAERRKRNLALTRPELAVLLAYAKLSLYSELLDSTRAGRSLSRARARALFPQGNVGALRRRAARAPAAARDHRHATHQFDDQPRRRHADRAHRRPDRRRAGGDRRRFRRRAQQLRPDRAQRRDRRARQQGVRARRSSAFTPPCRTCCSTGWSGSCAMSISSRGWKRSSGIIATASRRWKPRSMARCRSRRGRARCAGGGAGQGRRAGRAGAPHRQSCRAQGRARHRAGGRPRRQAGRRGDRDLFRHREPSSSSTASIGAVPGIVVSDYFDRLALDRALDSIGDAERRLTAAMVGNGELAGAGAVEEWVKPRAGGSRAHPRGDPRDRRLRADAVEAVGGGEPAGRFGEGVTVIPRTPRSGGRIEPSAGYWIPGSRPLAGARRDDEASMPEMPRRR